MINSKVIDYKLAHQLLDFGIICIIGTVIQFFSLYVLVEFLHIHYTVGASIAFILATIYSFIGNRYFTFRSKSDLPVSVERFIIVSAVAFVFNLALLYIFTSMAGVNYFVSQAIVGLIIFAVTFFIHKYWTYGV